MSAPNIEEATRAVSTAKSLALACHVGPDGDALGSMIGLGLAAKNAGIQVIASFGSPYVIPPSLSFLPLDLLVPTGDFPPNPDVMVVLDAGSADRIGDLAGSADAASTLVVLDHHVTNSGFGDIAVVDPSAAATGELVYELLVHVGWEITPEIALCLLTALVTDTGRFQYSNTTPTTLRIAADLVAAGADPAVVGRHVYDEAPFGYLKVSALAMDRATLHSEEQVVTTHVSREDLNELGVGWTDTENLIDLLRMAVEADTAILAKVNDDGSVKVSMRSRGDTDVGSLAASYGGGGHRLAAGFTAIEETQKLLADLVGSVGNYR